MVFCGASKTKNNKAGNRGRGRQHAQIGREPLGSTGADGAWPGDGRVAKTANYREYRRICDEQNGEDLDTRPQALGGIQVS